MQAMYAYNVGEYNVRGNNVPESCMYKKSVALHLEQSVSRNQYRSSIGINDSKRERERGGGECLYICVNTWKIQEPLTFGLHSASARPFSKGRRHIHDC